MLIGALDVSGSGVAAASTYLDVTSNNIANSGTTGYKSAAVRFQDLLYTGPAADSAAVGSPPVGTQLGAGTAVGSVAGLFAQGAMTPTGNPLDLAIDGNGFFAVTRPDGTTAYTRAGNFTTDAGGKLVSADGFPLAPGITVPPDATGVTIAADGTVTATTPTGVQTLGQLTLTQFPNPGGLLRVGDTLFAESPASGAAATGAPGSGGLGTVRQGNLESSNVDLTNELVNLLIAQRAVQANSQALIVESETLATTEQLIP